MDIKEAIEFLKEIKEVRSTYFKNEGNYQPFEHYASLFRDDEKVEQVISLLEQGEKYKKMWEEVNPDEADNR